MFICYIGNCIFVPKQNRYLVSRSIKQIKFIIVDAQMSFDINVDCTLYPIEIGQGTLFLSTPVVCPINI